MSPQCFFSCCAPDIVNDPKKKHYDAVQRHVETNGYRCGDLVQVYQNEEMSTVLTYGAGEEEEPMLFCRESHVCGASGEAHYYDPEGDIDRGRRVSTKHFC